MSHNISLTEKGASFVSAKEVAWHGLGTTVKEAMTSEECIKLALLDYEVFKQNIYIKDPNGGLELVPGKFATVRQDTDIPLGVVGSNYTVVQNTEAFSWFDNLVGEGEAMFETAGSLGNGERIFITAKLPDHITVNGDIIDKYLLLTNDHAGMGAVKMLMTPVRVVCQNTLSTALNRNDNIVSVRHTTNVKSNMDLAYESLGLANEYFNQVEGLFNRMDQTRLNEQQFSELIVNSIITNKDLKSQRSVALYKDVMDYVNNDPTQKDLGLSYYSAYNAITGYYQHVKEYKTPEKKLNSVLHGGAKWASENVIKSFHKAM